MIVHMVIYRDIIYPNGDKGKQALDFENLNDALTYADQDFKDRWEFYKNRYLKK